MSPEVSAVLYKPQHMEYHLRTRIRNKEEICPDEMEDRRFLTITR